MKSLKHSTVFSLWFLLVILTSCSDNVSVPIIEFSQPSVTDASLFDLDFSGMEVNRSSKEIAPEGLTFEEYNNLTSVTTEWNPFSTAMVIVHDYFRRGMINNLKFIYQSTFDFEENRKPVQDGSTFTWSYTAKIFNPDTPGTLTEADLILTADVTLSQVTWKLFFDEPGENLLLAKGFTYPGVNRGSWEFYFHDSENRKAFEFHWLIEQGNTVFFDGTLQFVDVTGQYERLDSDAQLIMNMNDKPETPVHSDIYWKSLTGDGSIALITNTINEKKCWDVNKKEMEECL